MFDHLFNQNVTLKKTSGTDSYGDPTVTETITIKCKLNFKNRLVKNSNGTEVTSRAEMLTNEAITLEDVITYNSTDYTVIEVNPIVDFDGNIDHYKVFY